MPDAGRRIAALSAGLSDGFIWHATSTTYFGWEGVRDTVAGPASPEKITDMGRHHTSHKIQGLPTSVSAPAFAVASPLLSSHEEWFDDGNGAKPTPAATAAVGALRDSSVTRRRRRSADEEGENGAASFPSCKRKVHRNIGGGVTLLLLLVLFPPIVCLH